ncbi:uncharacterized protein CTRU02_210513 [Colletotrichum truncatum]|uniref:Uncharacterized protein n=1 Tax=Colletotrichum truncatum TaxID=5467 RepID=A0ACC3YP71_COLTU|nr:uncharacterized protein CTRU02_12712 [Colletotrichum truncatum]KAF6784183.1 hypothetical protein CTRU02_12712 [Colletotrichum truncatum]
MRCSTFAVLSVPLVARAVAGQYENWKFGNMFRLGPAKNAIVKATYTIATPSVPCGYVQEKPSEEPWLSLWVGLSSSVSDQKADLFQPLLNWAPNNELQGCPAPNTQWCVAASTFSNGQQLAQSYIPIPAETNVDFELTYDAAKGVTQKVYMDGKLVSQQTDKTQAGQRPSYLYSSNECYLGTCGTVNGYTWENITVVLEKADADFGQTLDLLGASSGAVKTADNGKTWNVDSIKINEDHFYADGSKRKKC